MASLNKKAQDTRKDFNNRVAGGAGAPAAVQGAEALLRRSVMANLLWENNAYQDGVSIAEQIASLIPQVPAETVSAIAVEARTQQKLRHVPLLLVREMARHASHKHMVEQTLAQIILRTDEISEFLAIYWKDGRIPLAHSIRRGLAKAFGRFNEYSLAKYRGSGKSVSLSDAIRMVRPTPADEAQAALWGRVRKDELQTPDTWEVALSAGSDKKATWIRLIQEGKLGAMALLRNLRNMEEASVPESIIRKAITAADNRWLLPINYYSAAKEAPKYIREIESSMLSGLDKAQKLPGTTIFVVDVSGSMNQTISEKSKRSRLEVASIMAMIADATCEQSKIYVTGGGYSTHTTEMIKPYRGFALIDEIVKSQSRMQGGGIFTRQCLEYLKTVESETPDRIIIFSDSQDCDRGKGTPAPFGKKNYIVDVSAHTNGINYRGVWTAEISGWSDKFLDYIRAFEGVEVTSTDDSEE